ncbi:MAG: hypothetical protein N2042_01940 [Thermodesulfovibrio sp.]|nr:hypothetical protein [Thermodesulfovibrio sp.]
MRNALAGNTSTREEGFVFEYSATFGQILSEKEPEILKEYAKSIIFDYSYKYFYLDGYGKDFSVLNVKNVSTIDFSGTVFVANLLSFYEQLLVYEQNINQAKEYNLEKPLWIFVGTTVTGKSEESDVIQILDFINRVISDEKWLKDKIEIILLGKSGLKDENDRDVFINKFEHIKNSKIEVDELYKKIFSGKGKLNIYELKNAEGELGLKIGENEYFGVINIGNVSGFKKQLEKKGITVAQDVISSSLFDDIKKESSNIKILIGSKKFIEGWDTWRVSSMGLLNIGKGQGPQIIQLFGRGVRLKGKGMSLKRSDEKGLIRILETLNIYSIKADYLNRFLDAISKEEVEFETIEVPVLPQHKEKWENLYTLNKDESKTFQEEKVLMLELDERIFYSIDLMPKVSIYFGKERREGVKQEEVKAEAQPLRLTEEILNLFDWNRILEEIYEFKLLRGYYNLIIQREILEHLLLSERYKIFALPQILEIKTKEDILRAEDIAILIIKKYIDLFYKKYARKFESENLSYYQLGKQLTLFAFEKPDGTYSYTLQIDKRKSEFIEEIRKLIEKLDNLSKEEQEILPRVYFHNHLFIPILLQSKRIDKISPTGLVESEKEFLLGLKKYLADNKAKFSKYEIFLLRNYPKVGVGFFNLSGFYPDFIMWVKNEKMQNIVFIDPKGLEHTKGLDDEKVKLKDDIKELEKSLGNENIKLDSFIISKTPYEKLIAGNINPPSKEDYIDHHVLFLDDKWQEKLFSMISL